MKWDEFAFVNQQLATMLKDGIPLEGALQQLCATMARGTLRTEFQLLEADLAKGTPLTEALTARKLPTFYVQMIQVGVKSNNLPGVLTLLADYYQRSNLILTRLKGLMTYPLIVLLGCLALSVILALSFQNVVSVWPAIYTDILGDRPLPTLTQFCLWSQLAFLWGPAVVLIMGLAGWAFLMTNASLRRWLRWRVPASRDSSLWRFAAAMNLMLSNGCDLKQALALMTQIEEGTPAATELADWQARLATGYGRLDSFAAASRCFPRLFIWLVSSSGEDLTTGFQRAATIYHGRAAARVEALLYVSLPAATLALGGLIFLQVYSFAHFVIAALWPLMTMY